MWLKMAEFSSLLQLKNILLSISMRGTQNQHLLIKNRVFILTCLNSGHLRSALHLMRSTPQDVFPPLLGTVFELTDLDAF